MQSSLGLRFGAVIICTFIVLFGYQNCSPQFADSSGVLNSSSTDPSVHISVTSQPAATTVTVGATTYLVVGASSLDGKSLSYQWFLSSSAIAGATGSALTITNAVAANEGYYYASISDGTYTVYSASAWLQVGGGTGTCAVGSYNNAHCYLYVPTAMTFSNAASYCSSQGGILAKSLSASDNSFINTLVGGTTVFLGGVRSYGGFIWEDGTALSTGYTNWAPGEPNNAGGAESCVQMYGAGVWNDVNCANPLPFVCEI